MSQVTLYATPYCPYCVAARQLLDRKGVSYALVDIARDPAKRADMIQKAGGRRTVPQIFIGEAHIGGFDDMAALDRAGKLDALLAA